MDILHSLLSDVQGSYIDMFVRPWPGYIAGYVTYIERHVPRNTWTQELPFLQELQYQNISGVFIGCVVV